MKKIFLFFIVLLVAKVCFSQSGIAIGTSGLKFKSKFFELYNGVVYNPDNKTLEAYTSPNLVLLTKIIDEEKTKLYSGIKIGMVFTTGYKNYYHYNIPLGLEMFPFKNKENISLILETGFNVNFTDYSISYIPLSNTGFYSLFEIVFYFNKKHKVNNQ